MASHFQCRLDTFCQVEWYVSLLSINTGSDDNVRINTLGILWAFDFIYPNIINRYIPNFISVPKNGMRTWIICLYLFVKSKISFFSQSLNQSLAQVGWRVGRLQSCSLRPYLLVPHSLFSPLTDHGLYLTLSYSALAIKLAPNKF